MRFVESREHAKSGLQSAGDFPWDTRFLCVETWPPTGAHGSWLNQAPAGTRNGKETKPHKEEKIKKSLPRTFLVACLCKCAR